MEKSNYQILKELEHILPNEILRHRIIFYDTWIGSYTARTKKPESFHSARQITGRILEAEYIAKQREQTLKSLQENTSAKDVLKKLIARVSKFEYSVIYQDGELYAYFNYFKTDDLKTIVGNRLEKKLFKREEEIKENIKGRERKQIFLSEDCEMIHILADRVQELGLNNKYIHK